MLSIEVSSCKDPVGTKKEKTSFVEKDPATMQDALSALKKKFGK